MRRFLALLLLLALPLASAVNHTSQGTPFQEAPGEQESVEDAAGFSYGIFLVLGVLAFAAALAWASHKYHKRPPSP